MKPIPRLDDESAMILRGKQSALGSARNDALACLRDSVTRAQGCDWEHLPAFADEAMASAERLKTLAAMWEELK